MTFHHFEILISKLSYEYIWLVKIFAVLLSATIGTVVLNLIKRFLIKIFEKTRKIWDDALVSSLYHPLIVLFWLLAFTYSVDILKKVFPVFANISGVTNVLRQIGVILILAWVVMRFLKRIEVRFYDPQYTTHPRDKTAVAAVSKIVCFAVVVATGLFILQSYNIRISGVLAFGGASAIIAGFAAKDVLANFFGGFMIYLDRPFSVGDWVASPDRNIEGTVEYIGWRLTRIRTFDKRPLYVPNSVFSSVAVENPSRMTNRRIKMTFGVRYCDAKKVSGIVHDIKEMLENHSEIDSRTTLFVRLINLGSYSMDILVYAFTKTTDWLKFQEVQEDILLKIVDIIYDKHQAEITAPRYSIDMLSRLTEDRIRSV